MAGIVVAAEQVGTCAVANASTMAKSKPRKSARRWNEALDKLSLSIPAALGHRMRVKAVTNRVSESAFVEVALVRLLSLSDAGVTKALRDAGAGRRRKL